MDFCSSSFLISNSSSAVLGLIIAVVVVAAAAVAVAVVFVLDGNTGISLDCALHIPNFSLIFN